MQSQQPRARGGHRHHNPQGAGYAPVGPPVEDAGSTTTTTVRTLSAGLSAGWRLAIVLAVSVALASIAAATVGAVYGINTYRDQGRQDLRTDQIESTLVSTTTQLQAADAANAANIVSVNTTLCAKVVEVNNTLQEELMMINELLNITGNGTIGEVIQETIDDTIANAVTPSIDALNAEVADRIRTINGVNSDNVTNNLLMTGGDGISVAAGPGINQLTLSNTGVLSIVPAGVGLDVSSAIGDVVLENTGLVTQNWVPATGGNLDLLGTGMITITPDVNASTVTIDGSYLVMAINNLQMTDSSQGMQIVDLQNENAMQQAQIDAIETVVITVNGTEMDVEMLNATITDLANMVAMAKADIVVLQAQVAALTASNIPPGSMFPWASAAVAPLGYHLCDGTEYNTTDYPMLFAAVGNDFCGGGCAAGMFAVPDMRGKVPAGRATSGVFNTVVGTDVGTETHTLTVAEMPSHSHFIGVDGSHDHIWEVHKARTGPYTDNGAFTFPRFEQPDFNALAENSAGAWAPFFTADTSRMTMHTGGGPAGAGPPEGPGPEATNDGRHTHPVGLNGSGAAHANVQPSLVVQYIIKHD